MSKSINESKLTMQLEVTTQLWIRAENEPQDFYEEMAELLIDFNQIYNRDYEYFGYINAWCDLLSRFVRSKMNVDRVLKNIQRKSFLCYQEYFKSYTSKHLEALKRHKENETRNRISFRKRALNAVQKYSKTEVIRVNLGYIKMYHHLVNIQSVYDDVAQFRKAISTRKKPFHDLIIYSLAIEQGADKGYHIHVALFFNGHKRQSGWGIAKDVGEVWKSITGEKGCFHNGHDPETLQSYEERGTLGIGRIHRDNETEVSNMLDTVDYLTRPNKEAQHLRVKISSKMRTFQ
ncbi:MULTISPECIES: YagK/YfjJ domain-containing protein [unclassified Acinetobacter]|uniref:YagK/YfjJ domain-containing protein n=1 Tax=unclassified Acinetobacter TaxID=196816 RepID=UPI000DA6C527|nr:MULTISPECIES: inovirus-type Gp2 protein [unclassified Acinetobacter]